MGREIRMVPPNWEHPKHENPYTREMVYKPIHDVTFDEWVAECREWDEGLALWLKGEHPVQIEHTGDEEFDLRPIGIRYAEWIGERPDLGDTLPYSRDEATWVQMYETVSEGTPVSPPFATKAELVNYLVERGDFWSQKRGQGGWKRENAEAFVERGFAMSLVIENGKVYEPRDGMPGDKL